MHTTLTTLIARLESSTLSGTEVIKWGAPVLSFGDVLTSRVATLGLNPSNREFVNESGEELTGDKRRFPTLNSLGLRSWSEVSAQDLETIVRACRAYFQENPYDRWFGRLDKLISVTNASFYGGMFSACHLDLIPFATLCKWNELTSQQRTKLFQASRDTLGTLLRGTPVRILILNGTSVVEKFADIIDSSLREKKKPEWSLPRESTTDVMGYAYTGEVRAISGIGLSHPIRVLGFNHNLQGSFGVTKTTLQSIRKWIGESSQEVLDR